MTELVRERLEQAAALRLQSETLRLARELAMRRPSMMLRPRVWRNLDSWTAEYSGVFACGDSPEGACLNFDEAWTKGE